MNIFVTIKAKQSYWQISDYIENVFGTRTAKEFEQRLHDFFELLVNYPELGSLEIPNKNIRAFQVAKQTRIYYRIEEHEIIILNIFDVRQSQAKG